MLNYLLTLDANTSDAKSSIFSSTIYWILWCQLVYFLVGLRNEGIHKISIHMINHFYKKSFCPHSHLHNWCLDGLCDSDLCIWICMFTFITGHCLLGQTSEHWCVYYHSVQGLHPLILDEVRVCPRYNFFDYSSVTTVPVSVNDPAT